MRKQAYCLLVIVLLATACGATGDASPASPEPSASAPPPATEAAAVQPSTTPEPAPTPAPTATSTMESPTPAPTAIPEPTTTPDEPAGEVRITIVYDNLAFDHRLTSDWGFAAWVEYGGHVLLFDTGGNGAILMGNMRLLGLDPQRIETVVLSHRHGDHTGGLDALLDAGIRPAVYTPTSFPGSLEKKIRARAELVEVTTEAKILPGLHTTGQMGDIGEQSLVIETPEGMVVITGCAHPGIRQIVRKARRMVEGDVALVLGGFHLIDTRRSVVESIIADFQMHGVKRAAPAHCTGSIAMDMFAEAYGPDYVETGAGQTIVVGSGAQVEGAPWPTGGWSASTPEDQGIDSLPLADMLEAIIEQDYQIDNVLVARSGYLVLDAHRPHTPSDQRHAIYSCTKSVVSALVGIAQGQGVLDGVDQSLQNLFPGRQIANLDAQKKAMTLEHILTMSTGLDCQDSYLYRWQGIREMEGTGDWVQYVLDLPMLEEPASRFEYCNGASLLLSAIVQESTGKTALAYAQEHLFGPLGIEDVVWDETPQGVSIGWAHLYLAPRDMAKIGYLYLNQGQWDGQQVVPAEWVEESVRGHIPATLQDAYGFQWWVDNAGYYMALGYGGQFIYVVPEKDLVVVFASDLPESDFYVPQGLLERFILPAAQSSEPLPSNPAATDRLQELATALASP